MLSYHLYKHTFTQNNKKLDTNNIPPQESQGFFKQNTFKRIYLVEIDGETDPNDIELLLKWNEFITTQKSQVISFSLYRAKFIYQKDKYILDTIDITLFTIPEKGCQFSIEVESNKTNSPFIVNIFFQHIE
jgi:hypothetical protein